MATATTAAQRSVSLFPVTPVLGPPSSKVVSSWVWLLPCYIPFLAVAAVDYERCHVPGMALTGFFIRPPAGRIHRAFKSRSAVPRVLWLLSMASEHF